MVVTDLHLRTFLSKLDTIRENLHLRPLTEREIEEIVNAAGYSTNTQGIINPIFSRPKEQGRLYTRPINPYKEEKFKFTISEPLTIITKRSYNYNHDLNINKPIEGHQITTVNVLTPLTVRYVNLLTVIGTNTTTIKEKLKIFTECRGNIKSDFNVILSLKSKISGLLNVEIPLISRKHNRLKVDTPLESSRDKTILQNQSVYMRDIGEIDELELLEILGDIDALR